MVRYLPHAILVTLSVTALPFVVVMGAEASGAPVPLSTALGIVTSLALSITGSRLWMRRTRSTDVVFADLLIWGWIRRLRAERRISAVSALLESGMDGGSILSPQRQGEVLRDLAAALEARDAYSHGHTRRITRYCQMIARSLGLSGERVAKIVAAASLHDVGMLNVPAEIIKKPGTLTEDEFSVVKKHCAFGAEMVAAMGDPEITALVRHHHERVDGRGYPYGLSGHQIPLGARIIAVADTFDAITSARPHRAARRHKFAVDVLKTEAGSQLDPVVVDAFLACYSGRKSFAWWATVTLATAPQRLVIWLETWLGGAGAAGLAQQAAAVGAATVIGGSALMHGLDIAPRYAAPPKRAAVPARETDRQPEVGRRNSDAAATSVPTDSASKERGGSSSESEPETRDDSAPRDGSDSDNSGSGSDSSGSGSGSESSGSGGGTDSDNSGSGSDSSGSGGGTDSDNSGSGSDSGGSGGGTDSDNSGSGSDSGGSGGGSDSDNSGSGSDSGGSGSG
jgi:HD-GYP domain-containing protein (c-di-GMP phosphodiesterase class II)